MSFKANITINIYYSNISLPSLFPGDEIEICISPYYNKYYTSKSYDTQNEIKK